MDIYVKLLKKAEIKGKSIVHIGDIAQIQAPQNMKQDILNLRITQKDRYKNKTISITEVIKAIVCLYPESTVNSIGEQEVLIEFQPAKTENAPLKFLKVIFICIVLFTGGATAIMSFHSDSQMVKVFEQYTKMFLGENGDIRVIEISYSIGLAVGITTFFNHFLGKKITSDPTPIEVEMYLYDNDVSDTLIKTINNREGKEN